MTTIAAVVLIIGDEPYDACLTSLSHLDEIYVLTDEQGVLDSVRRLGAAGRLITRPTCLEEISSELLSATTSDWLLLIDPDERLVCTNPAALRSELGSAGADVVGYSLNYRFSFLGHPLHRTYEGLRKTKLVRPRNVQWPATIHSLPLPTLASDQFLDLPDSTVFIETELVGDVKSRLARHAHWVSIEVMARPGAPVSASRIVEALASPLDEYFSERSCHADGVAGILNGLLHLNKSITALLSEAAIYGPAEEDFERIQLLGKLLGQTAGFIKGGG